MADAHRLRLTVLRGLAVAVAYVVTARIGFGFALVAEQITTVWAPTGIAIAALLLWGRSLWPAVWVGAFLANAGSAAPLWTAAVLAIGNTLEATVAVAALQHSERFDAGLTRLRDVVAFIVVAAAASTMISATIGVTTLCAAGVQPWDRFAELWGNWWLGDAVGALVVAPVVLTTVEQRRRARTRSTRALLLICGASAVTWTVFAQVFGPDVGHHPLEYVIFPFVVAAAVGHGQPATAYIVLATSAITLWNTARGAGPFASEGAPDTLVLLQVFMGVLAGTGLLLAAAITERETGERRRAAAYAVGEVLAGDPQLATVATGLLQRLCETLDWPSSALWLVDPREPGLKCAASWSEGTARTPASGSTARADTVAPGVGLPGRVWASGAPLWITDIARGEADPERNDRAGMHAAFAFPIRLGSEVLGVIECFHRRAVPPDPDLLRTMSAVGNQIGQFMGRKREEAAVEEAEREREQLLAREAHARREAEAANRAKDEFLATLSHELRTPLNAIVGWTRMLRDGTMDGPSTKRALEVIDRNAHLQVQLVGDILDVSRIITGGLRLDLRPVDPGGVIGAALDAVRPAADAKNIRLRTRLDAVPVIQADPQRLQQVIWNLLSNAVKFTPAGGTVTIELVDADATLVIRVKDDGAGIDPEFLPFVFERFRQGDGSASRRHGGLGLGLAIVRHLVELHGGTVRADSAGHGLGATFTVALPRVEPAGASLAEGPRPDAADAASTALRGYRLIVVDDQDDARELAAIVLTDEGATVRTASSVGEALALLESDPPDALLADIGMPGADGYTLIREVRARGAQRGHHLPVVALTAYAAESDKQRAIAAGFDYHVSKPISRAALVSAVLAICRR